MTEVTNQLLYEVLKKIQDELAHVRARVDDHTDQLISIRDDIHGVRGDILRVERSVAETKVRVERIERRMGLVEA
jgi:septal ring factor EnvC (AmiA/AmiB activator)